MEVIQVQDRETGKWCRTHADFYDPVTVLNQVTTTNLEMHFHLLCKEFLTRYFHEYFQLDFSGFHRNFSSSLTRSLTCTQHTLRKR